MGELVRKMLPPSGLPRRLALQSTIFAIGEGTFLTGSVVFFTLYVGLSPIQIGIGFSVAGFLALVGSLPIGHLADRLGGRPAWVLGSAAGAAGFACYPLVGGFWTFLLVLAWVQMAEVLANAGRHVYTAAALPKETRVRVMAFMRAYLNVGFTAGAGLGALALALDSRAGLLVLVLANATGLTVNALMVSRMPAATAAPVHERPPSPWGVLRDRSFTGLAVLIGVIWLSGIIFGELIPLWAITMTDAPKPVLGALIALNTVLAVLLQVRATRGAVSTGGSARLLRWAALATAVACPVIALSGRTHGWATVAVLALGVVLVTATELWLSAAQWYFNTELPPPGQRGAYQGVGSTMMAAGRMVGPASMTFLAIHTGGWGWWVIAAVFAACAVAVGPLLAWVERTPRAVVMVTTPERAA